MGFWSAVGEGLKTTAAVAGEMLDAAAQRRADMHLVREFNEVTRQMMDAFDHQMRFDERLNTFNGVLPYQFETHFCQLSDLAQVMNAWAQEDDEIMKAELADDARDLIAHMRGTKY